MSSHIQGDSSEPSSTNNYSQVGFGWSQYSITPLGNNKTKRFDESCCHLAQCCVNLNTSGESSFAAQKLIVLLIFDSTSNQPKVIYSSYLKLQRALATLHGFFFFFFYQNET